jgi:putative ABC transport system permease protein
VRKTINILASSFRLTMQELMVNKLRTVLSLIGISFGIFCIIGVLATVNSLEANIQNEINSLGTNTIYIDKFDYSYSKNGPDFPWWKFINRPVPKFEEVAAIKQRSTLAKNVAFVINTKLQVEYQSYALENVNVFGVSEQENEIQPIDMVYGRFISDAEFTSGSPVAIIGYTNAENLFFTPASAIGKEIKMGDVKATIVGVIKKMGTSMIGWDNDQS